MTSRTIHIRDQFALTLKPAATNENSEEIRIEWPDRPNSVYSTKTSLRLPNGIDLPRIKNRSIGITRAFDLVVPLQQPMGADPAVTTYGVFHLENNRWNKVSEYAVPAMAEHRLLCDGRILVRPASHHAPTSLPGKTKQRAWPERHRVQVWTYKENAAWVRSQKLPGSSKAEIGNFLTYDDGSIEYYAPEQTTALRGWHLTRQKCDDYRALNIPDTLFAAPANDKQQMDDHLESLMRDWFENLPLPKPLSHQHVTLCLDALSLYKRTNDWALVNLFLLEHPDLSMVYRSHILSSMRIQDNVDALTDEGIRKAFLRCQTIADYHFQGKEISEDIFRSARHQLMVAISDFVATHQDKEGKTHTLSILKSLIDMISCHFPGKTFEKTKNDLLHIFVEVTERIFEVQNPEETAEQERGKLNFMGFWYNTLQSLGLASSVQNRLHIEGQHQSMPDAIINRAHHFVHSLGQATLHDRIHFEKQYFKWCQNCFDNTPLYHQLIETFYADMQPYVSASNDPETARNETVEFVRYVLDSKSIINDYEKYKKTLEQTISRTLHLWSEQQKEALRAGNISVLDLFFHGHIFYRDVQSALHASNKTWGRDELNAIMGELKPLLQNTQHDDARLNLTISRPWLKVGESPKPLADIRFVCRAMPEPEFKHFRKACWNAIARDIPAMAKDIIQSAQASRNSAPSIDVFYPFLLNNVQAWPGEHHHDERNMLFGCIIDATDFRSPKAMKAAGPVEAWECEICFEDKTPDTIQFDCDYTAKGKNILCCEACAWESIGKDGEDIVWMVNHQTGQEMSMVDYAEHAIPIPRLIQLAGLRGRFLIDTMMQGKSFEHCLDLGCKGGAVITHVEASRPETTEAHRELLLEQARQETLCCVCSSPMAVRTSEEKRRAEFSLQVQKRVVGLLGGSRNGGDITRECPTCAHADEKSPACSTVAGGCPSCKQPWDWNLGAVRNMHDFFTEGQPIQAYTLSQEALKKSPLGIIGLITQPGLQSAAAQRHIIEALGLDIDVDVVHRNGLYSIPPARRKDVMEKAEKHVVLLLERHWAKEKKRNVEVVGESDA